MQVNVLDCLGCSNCVNVCPGNKNGKALHMIPLDDKARKEQENWDKMEFEVTNKAELVDVTANVKNSQFATPLFQYSGACAGCGETPYVKLISQLFGDRQIVANATGCSSIYSSSAPTTAYTVNKKDKAPLGQTLFLKTMPSLALG